MKNRDFRLFDSSNLPDMNDEIACQFKKEIGDKLYENDNQKNLFKIKIIELFGSKCAYCGAQLNNVSAEQIDHYCPVNENNINDPKNLILTCFTCNNSKRKNSFPGYLHPYSKTFSYIFKRNEYGFIVPVDDKDKSAKLMAEKLKFSSISRSITYTSLLIDYLSSLLELSNKKENEQLLVALGSFSRKLNYYSNILCLKEKNGL